jgi:DNA-binding transcriptional LysR family regulator
MNANPASLGNLSLKQLRAFVTVAECKGFTAAAAALNLSQSAVSLLIRELESELGLKLLDRTTRSVRVTEAGGELLPVASRVLTDLGHALAGSRELAARKRGRVRLACSPLQASLLMPRVIAAFAERYPDIQVILRDTPGGEIIGLVESDEVDLALGVLPEDRPFVTGEPVMNDSVLLIHPAAHPWANRRRIGWRELAAEPFIALGPHNTTRQLVDQHAAAAGVTLATAYEVAFAWTAIGMVEAGLGVSLIPAYAGTVVQWHAGVAMRPFEERSMRRPVSLLQRRQRSLSPAAESFRDFFKDFVRAHPPTARPRAKPRP